MQPTWEEQLEYEAAYAENTSFMLDLKILIAVFKGALYQILARIMENMSVSLCMWKDKGKRRSSSNDMRNTSTGLHTVVRIIL